MQSLIYVSTANHTMDAADIAALRTQASRNNVRCGITGLLVYDGARFMQLLEGADRVVEATMRRIRTDSRHGDIEIVRETSRDERECPDWSMRVLALPLTGDGSASDFAASLPEQMGQEARMLFTSFASSVCPQDIPTGAS